MSDPKQDDSPETTGNVERRTFLSGATTAAMAASLAASYGTLGWIAVRFLYPETSDDAPWLFVGEVDRVRPGGTMSYRVPGGELVTIRRREGGDDEFVALSTTCPHLGCRVHWQAHLGRFFCPCHNGVFDAEGRATEGPPAEAGQALSQYPLRVENGLLFIRVSPPEIVRGGDAAEAPRNRTC